jgi:nucleotide-binding universal stress UspA family protein
MQRGLVLVEESDDHRDLLREAMEHAVGADADLVLLTTVSGDALEAGAQALESIGRHEGTSYDADTVLDGAVADVRSYFDDVVVESVDVTVVARATDDPAGAVLEVAADRGCDHVFAFGDRRSPTGKALFGDVAQQVALNFDGYVTLATR